MSTKQKRTELLTFGYVNQTYALSVPIALIHLMQIYYDKYRYFCLKDEMLNKFFAAKKCELLDFCKFKVQDIEFGFISHPNGNKMCVEDLVIVGIEIINIPKDIEYFDYYQELQCDTLYHHDPHHHCIDKQLQNVTKSTLCTMGVICKLSQLKDMNLDRIDFNFYIHVKYIKYKKESNKKDYIGSINKIHKMSKFKWNINGSMMEKCKKMQFESLRSHNFDDNNWFLRLIPNGYNRNTAGNTAIGIFAASLSLNGTKINVEQTLLIDGVQYQQSKSKIYGYDERLYSNWKIMAFTEFKKRESISFEVILKIINVYDENDDEIEKKEWCKYGII